MAVQGPRSRKSRSIQDMVMVQNWSTLRTRRSTKAGKYVDDNNVLHSFHRTPLSDFLDRFVLFFFFFDRRPRIHPKDRCNVLARLATQRRETTASNLSYAAGTSISSLLSQPVSQVRREGNVDLAAAENVAKQLLKHKQRKRG